MSEQDNKSQKAIHIGGYVEGSAVVLGDSNTVNVSYEKIELPPADSVDVDAEVASLKQLLGDLGHRDQRKVDNAIEEVEDELSRDEPDRDEVGRALERALEYTERAGELTENIDKIAPHVKNVVAWLGESWHKLLPLVGLIV